MNRNPLDDMHATMDIFRIVQGGNVIDREGLASQRQEVVPRPGLVAEGFANPALKVPFIDEIWPELISTKDKLFPGDHQGKQFLQEQFRPVQRSDRSWHGPGRQRDPDQYPAGLTKAAGVYPLVVVQPGSAGGVSNTFYFMVTTK